MLSIADQPAPRSAGRYEIHEEIGRGGMGSIHRAVDRFTSRVVAYKRMLVDNEHSRARAMALFRREYEALSRLPHPNIVQVYDYGLEESGPFYVMELLSGDDLTKVAPLDVGQACRVLRDVASALALLHARRLLHRDISPNNIRLTADGRAKLLDFGALTPFGRPKEIVGTPVCIAPECLEAANLDQRVDLYALGAVAYWLLTRRTHLRASSVEELASALEEPPVPPSFHVPGLPAALDDLVMALLARDRIARPDSAAAVIEKLTVIGGVLPESDERAVAFSYLARPPLVGREEALERLQSSVDEALEAKGSSVLVEAHPGTGRSAVLDDLAFYAQSTGATVLRVHGELEKKAFSAVGAIVESLHALYPDMKGLEAGRSGRPSSASSAGSSRVDSAVQAAERRATMLATAKTLVLEAANRAPLLLVIDDVDELDEPSASLVASLSSESAERPIAIIASAATTHDAARSPALRLYAASASSMVLDPLSTDQFAELVRRVFGPVPNAVSFAKWLHAQSGGLPAAAMDVARLLLQQGCISYTRGTFALPADADRELQNAPLAQANLSRLGGVGDTARSIAVALALHGRSLSLQQISSALPAPLATVVLAIEELVSADVVTLQDDVATLSSAAMSAALTASVGDDEKRALHQRLGEMLLASDDVLAGARLAASSHYLKAGLEQRALDAVGPLMQRQFSTGPEMVPWVSTLEELLAIYMRQGRRKEECLSLMVLLVNVGFYGDLKAQTRHIDLTLSWMSLVCGMTMARRCSRWVGPKAGLAVGLIYASLRRGFTPKAARLGTIPQMLDALSRLVSAAIAAAASALDSETARRAVLYLEPFAALPPHTPGYLIREFCLATCDLVVGSIATGLERYERLLPLFSKPIKGLGEDSRQQLILGSLNGLAQGGLWFGSKRVLEVADQLARDPFFAPHAESARMFYYAYRGERDQADVYRTRVELAALHGGTSWSAMVLVAAHAGQVAIRTRDHVALIHTVAEQRRLANIAPSLEFTAYTCEVWLEHLRGNSAEAARGYESVLFRADTRGAVGWRSLAGNYGTVLCALGRYEEAKQICLQALEGETDPARVHIIARDTLMPLAFAEQGLGNHGVARDLMDRMLEHAKTDDNPLRVGNLHRDRAQLALLQSDKAAFELHFAKAQALYRTTNHPSLIMQVEALATDAERAGMRARAHGSREFAQQQDFDGETTIEVANDLTTARIAN
jgi:tRNA A-37 threonylcarbamoyl transferase component Bud32/tetratricopeptide (TPR) repeat protein